MLIHKVIHDSGWSRPLAARSFRSRGPRRRAGLGGARAGVACGARTSPGRSPATRRTIPSRAASCRSSTPLLANSAAYLQALREGQGVPASTGEIGLLDNRTVLHASYDPRPKQNGYPIAIRYLYQGGWKPPGTGAAPRAKLAPVS